MGFNKIYRTLFNVEILHHYFLDEGEDIYGSGLDADKMEKNLSVYGLSSFMSVKPTQKTVTTLRNLRSRFIQTKQGFLVVTAEGENDEPFIPFSDDLSFDFVTTLKDPFFENYTDLTIDRDVPLFLSNKTPSSSTEESAISVRFCPMSDFETTLTNGSGPTAPMVEVDIDLEEVDAREMIGAFAIIRIHLNGDAGEITLTDVKNVGNPDGAKQFNGTIPEVNWMFDNRSTTWKYHRSSDSVEVHASVGEKPLTKHGYISIKDGDDKQYPNPSVNMIYNGELVGEDPTKKYSRTFI